MRRFLLTLAACANLVLLDAVTKELAVGTLKGAAPRDLIPNVLSLAYVENRGCAWGMFQGQVWPLAVFGLLMLVLLVWKRRAVFPPSRLGFAAEVFLYSGIVGNVIDRLVRGHVVDFIDVHWRGAWHFPCFNVADTLISCAAILLVFEELHRHVRGKRIRNA